MRTILLNIKGTSPLLMHSDRYANPLDPMTKQHKALTSKRKKTDDDYLDIARSEFIGGLYFEPGMGVYMPTSNLRKCIVEGARLNKSGKQIERGSMILEERVPLEYDGPKDPDGLWADKRFVDIRSVVVSNSRLPRCRPIFREWACQVSFVYDEKIIDLPEILQAANNAGSYIGVGNLRPNKGGTFGRFEVTEGKE